MRVESCVLSSDPPTPFTPELNSSHMLVKKQKKSNYLCGYGGEINVFINLFNFIYKFIIYYKEYNEKTM